MLSGMAAGLFLALTSTFTEQGIEILARSSWLLAALFIQLRLLANLLDGMVAILQEKASRVGELYNELPDRVSDSAILIGLGYASGGSITWGYLAALFAMATAYVRTTGKAAGASHDFSGPMAKQQRMFLATLVALYCGLLPSSLHCLTCSTFSLGIPGTALVVIALGSLLTTFRRVLRIAQVLKSA